MHLFSMCKKLDDVARLAELCKAHPWPQEFSNPGKIHAPRQRRSERRGNRVRREGMRMCEDVKVEDRVKVSPPGKIHCTSRNMEVEKENTYGSSFGSGLLRVEEWEMRVEG